MIRIAIIGLGYWGPNLLRNFAAQADCEIAYACDLDVKNLEKMRRQYPSVTYTKNVDDVLNDASIELVVIAVPTSAHFSLAKKASEAGKHVFIEKPMTQTVAEAERLIALAKKQGKFLFVDHTFVFTSAVQKIAELAGGGTLGKLLYFDSVRINLGLIQKDTNVFRDLAIHDLSILSSLVDLATVQTIAAHGSAYFGQHAEVGHLHLGFASGFSAHIHVSWLSPVKIRQTIVAGSKGMVVYDDTHPSEKIRVYDRGVERDDTRPDPFFPKYRAGDIVIPALPLVEALGTEAEHVLRCIRGQEQPLVSGEAGRNVMRILEIADRALHEQKTIVL